MTNPLEQFRWTPQPAAEKLLQDLTGKFLESCSAARNLRDRMRDETGTRFGDWIDSMHLPASTVARDQLLEVDFVQEHRADESRAVFVQPAGVFPRVVLHDSAAMQIWLKVESVADFAAVWGIPSASIEGEPLSVMRRAKVGGGPDAELWVIERHGHRGFSVPRSNPGRLISGARHLESFRTRPREFAEEPAGFDHAQKLIQSSIAELGKDMSADLFFAAEREFWQRRNRAAQFQKARQDRLGLGWANHDHHTYRSSRKYFSRLIGIFEQLGFVCRERFYAGATAGWGAQVLEQPDTGLIIFADVDLSPEELFNDFAHEPLSTAKTLGTVGLWCALHGEAFLQAGMHHLECQFDFEQLKQQLEETGGVRVMKPFTDFPHLRQAFTEGERWPVSPRRIDALLQASMISSEQADQFRQHGAIGSHLENLERNAGFKGFNQSGVSDIIARTDPRRQHEVEKI